MSLTNRTYKCLDCGYIGRVNCIRDFNKVDCRGTNATEVVVTELECPECSSEYLEER